MNVVEVKTVEGDNNSQGEEYGPLGMHMYSLKRDQINSEGTRQPIN